MKAKKKNKNEELWNKIRCLIKLITKNSGDGDEKYMKIKFSSDDQLVLNNTSEVPSMTIGVRVVFDEGKKYCPQAFLDECLYII